MKKILSVVFTILTVFCSLFSGCDKKRDLSALITELRSDVFMGTSGDVVVNCNYGFSRDLDGKNYLTFSLKNKESSLTTYKIVLEKDKTYLETFTLCPVTHKLTAKIQIDDFCEKEFEVKILFGSESVSIVMKSLLPENTITYKDALNCLYKNQPTLVDGYFSEAGVFNAKLTVRVSVRKEKAYYFIAFKTDKVTALLIDGKTGEVLAVRDVY